MTVWVDAWQMQCCSEPFTVGSEVSWTLCDVDSDWLAMVLGDDVAVTVDAAEERHSARSGEVPVTRAKVGHITAVHCRYAPRPGADSRTRYPVEGSGTLTAIASADGRRDARRAEARDEPAAAGQGVEQARNLLCTLSCFAPGTPIPGSVLSAETQRERLEGLRALATVALIDITCFDSERPSDWPAWQSLLPHIRAMLLWLAPHLEDDALIALLGVSVRTGTGQTTSRS